jgi:hypothetical protein
MIISGESSDNPAPSRYSGNFDNRKKYKIENDDKMNCRLNECKEGAG